MQKWKYAKMQRQGEFLPLLFILSDMFFTAKAMRGSL